MTIERDNFFVVEEIVPSVVEPSYGVGWIVYALLEVEVFFKLNMKKYAYHFVYII